MINLGSSMGKLFLMRSGVVVEACAISITSFAVSILYIDAKSLKNKER